MSLTPPRYERIQSQVKLRLTAAQVAMFDRWLWHLTGVYNWALKTLEHEPSLSRFDLRRRVNGHGVKLGVYSKAIAGTIDTAYLASRRHRKGLSGRPKLKGRRRRLNSIAFSDGIQSWKGSRPVVPGVGPVRAHAQDVPVGHCGYARLLKRASGWYLCLTIQCGPEPIARVASGQVGIDPGFSSLLTLSNGEVIQAATELGATAERLAQAQRGHSRRLTARLHERVVNQRKNRNHHISRRLVAENALIAFSKDQTSKIASRFGKSVAAAGHAQLRSMLAYKSRSGGARYIEVPSRNSTRTCSTCGALTGPTGLAGLSVRLWDCGDCGSRHDRDLNAARNTLKAGLGMSLKGGRKATSETSVEATPRSPMLREEGVTP